MMKLSNTNYSLTNAKMKFNHANIDELLDIQHNQLSLRVEKWKYEGSSRIINSIIQHQIVILEIALCEKISYFPLTKELRNTMKDCLIFKT